MREIFCTLFSQMLLSDGTQCIIIWPDWGTGYCMLWYVSHADIPADIHSGAYFSG